MNTYDAVLVGGGIMSATLAVLLHELDPFMKILLIERLCSPGLESSAAKNNAGTGHAANCELNYTPKLRNGQIDVKKALSINAAFELSLEFWASLTSQERLEPNKFLNQVPHISFVWGEEDLAFLKQRFAQINIYEAFSDMTFSSDPSEINEWMPLVMKGRDLNQKIGATKIDRGTDIDFGALTRAYIEPLLREGCLEVIYSTEVVNLYRNSDSKWNITLKNKQSNNEIKSSFVFLGCGGGSLSLLQRSKIPEGFGYGGFPVSGQWLVCSNADLVDQHNGKVYGKAKIGSPPMSVPHLDSRWISGEKSLLFGPFAGFSSKFLKEGSYFDLFDSINTSNYFPMIDVGLKNVDLIRYLIKQLLLNESNRLGSLKDFYPEAKALDWSLSVAGQRVQIIKKTSKGGELKMGTEVVTSSDGSIAALLGASPGASTAVKAMLEIVERCWPEKIAGDLWKTRIRKLLPSYGQNINNNPTLLSEMRLRNNYHLGIV
tara:strand:- start:904 stop:2367 length:1464 start_codon:yes stop_codon:yes gene_type:complete